MRGEACDLGGPEAIDVRPLRPRVGARLAACITACMQSTELASRAQEADVEWTTSNNASERQGVPHRRTTASVFPLSHCPAPSQLEIRGLDARKQ